MTLVSVLALAACATNRIGSITEGSAGPVQPTATSTPSLEPDADPALSRFYTQALAWSSCGGAFRCAQLTVPLDYARPEGDTIKLAVIKLPAASSAGRIGAMVINPGGPGSSGVDFARAARAVFSKSLLNAYDTVGFDPRGVQRSDPVTCLDDKQFDAYLALDGTPDNPAEVSALEAMGKQFGAACQAKSAKVLGHVSTPEAARDIDILRAALGEKRLTWFGFSYGTELGATYADLFPNHVARMVLDGAVDPSLSNVELQHGQAKGFEASLQRFVENCDRQPDCPLPSGTQAGLDKISSFFRGLDSAPLSTGDPKRPLTEALAEGAVLSYLYFPAYGDWDQLRQGLAAAFDGDGSVLLAMLDERQDRNDSGHYTTNATSAYMAVTSLADPARPSAAQVQVLAGQWSREAPILGSIFAWGSLGWSEWPIAATATPHELHAKGAPPILVVGTTYDPATPYPWAQALARQLDSGVLLTRVGDGHTGYGKGSTCTDTAVDRYLLTGTPPTAGTVCR